MKRAEHLGYPDLNDLPRTAQRIVDAATAILIRDGWDALTIPNIAEEAGVYAPAINYYFRGIHGLVLMIFDGMMRDAITAMRELIDDESGSADLSSLASQLISKPDIIGSEADLAFFESLSHLLRDAELRERTVERYRAWEQLALDLITRRSHTTSTEDARVAAALLLATVDGLTLRGLIFQEDANVEEQLALFVKLLEEHFETKP